MKQIIRSILFVMISGMIYAQGRIILPENLSSQMQLKSENVDVIIKNGLAKVTLKQVFAGNVHNRTEGTYLFPLPDNSEIHDFSFRMNGIMTTGRILDAVEARNEYANIVRRLRDPALLEYVNGQLYKAKVFPIIPGQDPEIELTYAQILGFHEKNTRLTIPLRFSGVSQLQKFHVNIDLSDMKKIGNIYSPTHDIQIKKINSHQAVITMEKNNLTLDKDLVLIYSIDEREITSSFLSFRPRTDKDGYFMWMVTPEIKNINKHNVSRDIIFVLDVSGSMGGEKIVQAKNALKFCLRHLDAADRFDIINFSSSVDQFKGKLINANRENIENALYFADQMRADGGTNINEALLTALRLKYRDNGRPGNIIFLTDGLPTEGTTNVRQIIANVNKNNDNHVRIFSFGVGYDVNTFLLDKLAFDSHGSTDYIKPGEPLEVKVAAFFARITEPVLANPKLVFSGVNVYDIYPQKLPDLFQGQKILVFGRYRGYGEGKAILTGDEYKKTGNYQFSVDLARRENENDFIAKLWANRKIAHLLSEIRFNGETTELVQSVKNLGIEFGIVTPYTSYLVAEQKKEITRMPVTIEGQRLRALDESRQAAGEEAIGSDEFYNAVSKMYKKAESASGKGAVTSSAANKRMADTDKADDMLITSKQIAGRSFYLKKGIWTETGLEKGAKADSEIKFLSDEYFVLLNEDKILPKILSIGESVKFKWKGKIYLVR